MQDDLDVRLMLEFKNGNVRAFEEIVKKYKKIVLNIIYKSTGNKEDAEDLAQEIFIRVYNARENYKPKSKFSTWLFKITSNICIDNLRKLKKTQEKEIKKSELIIENIPDPKQDSNRKIYRNELYNAVRNAIDSLTHQQKIACILSKFENLSNEEIAEILGTSVSAIKSLLHRAKLELREKLLPYSSSL